MRIYYIIVRHLIGVAICLISTLVVANTDWTNESSFDNEEFFHIAKGNKNKHITLDQATAKVKKDTGGRILSSKTITTEKGVVHRIKMLLPNGKVRIIHIDAN